MSVSKSKAVDAMTTIAVFKGRQVRRVLHQDAWWFSVVDVVAALTDSVNPRDYWFRMKVREKNDAAVELSTICRQLKLESSDGKKNETDCADTEGIFRIIQSIPSPKAEPFKRWLAKVGFERVKEIENPELATKRTRMLYKLKADAHAGGRIAGDARTALEKRLKRPIVSPRNYLRQHEGRKRLKY